MSGRGGRGGRGRGRGRGRGGAAKASRGRSRRVVVGSADAAAATPEAMANPPASKPEVKPKRVAVRKKIGGGGNSVTLKLAGAPAAAAPNAKVASNAASASASAAATATATASAATNVGSAQTTPAATDDAQKALELKEMKRQQLRERIAAAKREAKEAKDSGPKPGAAAQADRPAAASEAAKAPAPAAAKQTMVVRKQAGGPKPTTMRKIGTGRTISAVSAAPKSTIKATGLVSLKPKSVVSLKSVKDSAPSAPASGKTMVSLKSVADAAPPATNMAATKLQNKEETKTETPTTKTPTPLNPTVPAFVPSQTIESQEDTEMTAAPSPPATAAAAAADTSNRPKGVKRSQPTESIEKTSESAADDAAARSKLKIRRLVATSQPRMLSLSARANGRKQQSAGAAHGATAEGKQVTSQATPSSLNPAAAPKPHVVSLNRTNSPAPSPHLVSLNRTHSPAPSPAPKMVSLNRTESPAAAESGKEIARFASLTGNSLIQSQTPPAQASSSMQATSTPAEGATKPAIGANTVASTTNAGAAAASPAAVRPKTSADAGVRSISADSTETKAAPETKEEESFPLTNIDLDEVDETLRRLEKVNADLEQDIEAWPETPAVKTSVFESFDEAQDVWTTMQKSAEALDVDEATREAMQLLCSDKTVPVAEVDRVVAAVDACIDAQAKMLASSPFLKPPQKADQANKHTKTLTCPRVVGLQRPTDPKKRKMISLGGGAAASSTAAPPVTTSTIAARDIQNMGVPRLKRELRKRNAPVTGIKTDLQRRLAELLAKET